MARGRKGKYETHVKPRFDEIAEWLKAGATDAEIAANLGIHKATMCDYKNKYPEFAEFLLKGRKTAVQEIKAALFKRATGYEFREIQEIEEGGVIVKRVTYIKYAHPDPASAMILLKHWARDEGWTNDPAQLEVRKQELELKRQQVEKDDW